ncbi:MAG TPA: aminoacyl-tRNA hydrolase [Terriglobales bacterium]|nr:aminoacyl-tRNA hydrolase [Terriglobales bacterium]
MKLVVGLGNPGIEYQFTPHNLGFLTIDRIAERGKVDVASRRCQAATAKVRLAGHEVMLAKPETFMNLSGLSVRKLVEDLGVEPAKDLIVVYDELDLPFGTIRIRQRGGTAGHNGLESVVGSLGTDEFVRVRLGIDPDHPVRDAAKFVLAQFKKSHLEAVDELIGRGADAVEAILKDGLAAAMNRFNQRQQKLDAGED